MVAVMVGEVRVVVVELGRDQGATVGLEVRRVVMVVTVEEAMVMVVVEAVAMVGGEKAMEAEVATTVGVSLVEVVDGQGAMVGHWVAEAEEMGLATAGWRACLVVPMVVVARGLARMAGK